MKEEYNSITINDSEELQHFVHSLESRYYIEQAQDKYHNLVNFSANASVPYHQWFKYREGFAGELISELISMSGAAPGECIIDPFCGSGTTNVVASLNGYDTLGLDVNPMSAFIADAKVDHYTQADIDQTLVYMDMLTTFFSRTYKAAYSDIKKYFSKNNYDELVRIRTFIDTLTTSKAKRLLCVAFDSIVMECSERKRDGNGLKQVTCRVKDVFGYYADRVNLIIQDIKSISPATAATGHCIYDTAYNLQTVYSKNFGNKHAGAIIFSPPYANSFDYFESYKLELVFGGYANGIKGINALRKKAVRSFIGGASQETCDHFIDLIALEIENAIPLKEAETGKRDARTRRVPNMIRGYFSDMREVIRQCSLVLDPGKKTYIVVDQSAYCGKIVPTDLILAYFGEQEGFTVGRIIECRKARTSTQQLNKYPYLKNSLRESIVELIKK